jgi:hypothetical protein
MVSAAATLVLSGTLWVGVGACGGQAPEERCAAVHRATCPAAFPNANPDFAYDYQDPGEPTDCVQSLEGVCSGEFDAYVECLIQNPTCCEDSKPEGFQCQYTNCNQDAYVACAFSS